MPTVSRFTVLRISGWTLLLSCLACGSSTEPANEPALISIAPGSGTPLNLNIGAQVLLTVVVKNSAGVQIQSPGTIAFASRNSSVAAVDGAGKVTAVHAGVTYVVASLPTGTGVLLDSVQIDVFNLVGSARIARPKERAWLDALLREATNARRGEERRL